MKQIFILITFLLFSFLSFSKGKESLPTIWIIKDSVSNNIHPDSVRFVFNVEDLYGQLMLNQHPVIIQVKVDGKTSKHTVTDKNPTFKLALSKGKHKLAFYVNANFEEIHFEREFTGKHYYEVGLNFQGSASSGRQIMLEKPVIYLYSEKEEPFTLKIKTDGELQFTYPVYENEWKGTTSADGTIQINSSAYPYLFWDAQLPIDRLNLNWQNSDQIPGEQTMQYLSACLDNLGFTPKEKADFITYWGPRMKQMNYLQILWIQNESVNEIASLEISPKFTQNRIYIVFREIGNLIDETLPLKLNTLTPINRSKNYLVEWGGIEIQSNL